jgi:hypothetical protein
MRPSSSGARSWKRKYREVSEFVTAFEITRGSNGTWSDMLWRLATGVSALSIGLIGLIRAWRHRNSWRDYVWSLATIAWACAWILLHNFSHVFGHVNGLVDAYKQQRYEIAEGDVKVLHSQPATGHTKGDVIRVGGAQFEINYFYATPAYHNTIAHGGVLKESTRVRLYHYNGEILRVDVEKQ